MRLAVSDASPIRYLILIGEIDLLHRLYGSILIPSQVATELMHIGAPSVVQAWMADPPSWLSIHAVTIKFRENLSASLDPGEHDSILLALQSNTRLIVMDDRDGVHEARRQGLEVIGTLGILDYARLRGFLNLPAAIARLQTTTFRAAPSLIERLLSSDAARTEDLSAGGGASDPDADAPQAVAYGLAET